MRIVDQQYQDRNERSVHLLLKAPDGLVREAENLALSSCFVAALRLPKTVFSIWWEKEQWRACLWFWVPDSIQDVSHGKLPDRDMVSGHQKSCQIGLCLLANLAFLSCVIRCHTQLVFIFIRVGGLATWRDLLMTLTTHSILLLACGGLRSTRQNWLNGTDENSPSTQIPWATIYHQPRFFQRSTTMHAYLLLSCTWAFVR